MVIFHSYVSLPSFPIFCPGWKPWMNVNKTLGIQRSRPPPCEDDGLRLIRVKVMSFAPSPSHHKYRRVCVCLYGPHPSSSP